MFLSRHTITWFRTSCYRLNKTAPFLSKYPLPRAFDEVLAFFPDPSTLNNYVIKISYNTDTKQPTRTVSITIYDHYLFAYWLYFRIAYSYHQNSSYYHIKSETNKWFDCMITKQEYFSVFFLQSFHSVLFFDLICSHLKVYKFQ